MELYHYHTPERACQIEPSLQDIIDANAVRNVRIAKSGAWFTENKDGTFTTAFQNETEIFKRAFEAALWVSVRADMENGEPHMQLAGRFVENIRQAIAPIDFLRIRLLNKSDDYQNGACATHNFLDANQIMLDAFNEEMERAADLHNEDDSNLISAAWSYARAEYLTAS